LRTSVPAESTSAIVPTKVRLDNQTHAQLQDVADQEAENVSIIVRRYVRGLKADVMAIVSANGFEFTGRDQTTDRESLEAMRSSEPRAAVKSPGTSVGVQGGGPRRYGLGRLNRPPRPKLMEAVRVSFDDETVTQLQDVAGREAETVSLIVRRYVRRGLKADIQDGQGLARAHEGTGRVR
jgi:predicted transcriptional regulator